MLVDLEDKGRGVGRVLQDAEFALIVVDGAIEIVLVDALCTGHSQPADEVHNGGIVSRVENPLNS